ncbi:MAG: hypothetical protein AABW50_04670 [Nanoarchaeota archaeon]
MIEEKYQARFEEIKNLDSMVFIKIPKRKLSTEYYRFWLVNEVEIKWMTGFNGNQDYMSHAQLFFDEDEKPRGWNEEDGICEKIGGEYIGHCKFYRHDGNFPSIHPQDWRKQRGVLIRDHYSEFDVVKVDLIATNLEQFLKEKKI